MVNGIGEPVTISGLLASASPILTKMTLVLAAAEKLADKAQGLAKKAEQTTKTIDNAAKNFESATGVNPKDVIWKKDAGVTADKNTLSKDDLKKVDDETAKKVALALTEQRAKQTGILPNIDNKLLLIGGGLAVAGVLIFANKKR
jgi:hypothetical protein